MRSTWRSLMYAGLGLAAVAGLVYAFLPPPAEIEIARVLRGRLEVTVDEDGKTRIKERYVVVAPLGGELLRVQLHAGDPVKASETVLAVIQPNDPSLLDVRAQTEAQARVKAAGARLEHAKALLNRAQASRTYAMAEHDRAERLLPSKTVTQEQYDLALHFLRTASEDVRAGEFAVRIATFELELAQAALIRIRPGGSTHESRLEVRAPISGEVLHVFRESEGMLPAGTPLMELGDAGDLEVEVDVLSADAVRIPLGGKVHLEHWGSPKPLLARVRLVEPQAFLKVSALGVEEQRVNVIADFVEAPESAARLGDAYRVEARIVIWEGDVLKLNAGALFRFEGGWAAYRIVNGHAALTKVDVGQSSGLETEIRGGLDEGDEIVAYPSDQISDGVRVVARSRRH